MATTFTGNGVTFAGTYLQPLSIPPSDFEASAPTGNPPGSTFFTNATAFVFPNDPHLTVGGFGFMAADASIPPAGIAGNCSFPQTGGNVTIQTPNGRTNVVNPGDPTYPTVTDLRVFSAGSAIFQLRCVANAVLCSGTPQGGQPGVIGGVTANQLLLSYPPNTVLSPGGGGTSVLDFNNLPTFSVVSTTGGCGTSGYTFGITNGSLPAGLSLDPTTGVLSGTPTATGPYSFSVYAEKKSISTYCWGSVDYAGLVVVSSGGVVFAGTAFGPLYINAIPQWQVHRFDLRQRPENKS